MKKRIFVGRYGPCCGHISLSLLPGDPSIFVGL